MSATRDRLERAEQARARAESRRGNAVPAGLRPRRFRHARVLLWSATALAALIASAAALRMRPAEPDAALELELAEPQRVGAGAAAEVPAVTSTGAHIESLALERDPSGTRLRVELDAPPEHRLEVSKSGRQVALIVREARVERELERLDPSGTEIDWLDLRPEPPDLRVVMGLREQRMVTSASYTTAHGSTLVVDLLPRHAESAPPAALADDDPEDVLPEHTAGPVKRRAALPDADAHYASALAAERVGRVDEAVDELRAALEARPSNAPARLRLAQLQASRGAREEALDVLRAGRELEPARADLALLQARLLAEDQQTDPALVALESVPAAERSADFHALNAAILAGKGDPAHAIEAFSAAQRMDPRRGPAWLGLAISFEAEKRAPQARAAYKRALQVGGLEPSARAWAEERFAVLGSAP